MRHLKARDYDAMARDTGTVVAMRFGAPGPGSLLIVYAMPDGSGIMTAAAYGSDHVSGKLPPAPAYDAVPMTPAQLRRWQ